MPKYQLISYSNSEIVHILDKFTSKVLCNYDDLAECVVISKSDEKDLAGISQEMNVHKQYEKVCSNCLRIINEGNSF